MITARLSATRHGSIETLDMETRKQYVERLNGEFFLIQRVLDEGYELPLQVYRIVSFDGKFYNIASVESTKQEALRQTFENKYKKVSSESKCKIEFPQLMKVGDEEVNERKVINYISTYQASHGCGPTEGNIKKRFKSYLEQTKEIFNGLELKGLVKTREIRQRNRWTGRGIIARYELTPAGSLYILESDGE